MKTTIFFLILSFSMLSCQNPPATGEAPDEVDNVIPPVEFTKALPKNELSLKILMKQLGRDMDGINNSIWAEDFPSILKSADAIAEHPNVGPLTKARLVKTLGKEMGLFAAGDKRVHDASKRLGEAAKQKDMNLVLTELTNLQNGCVACHATFRGRLLETK